MQTPLSIRLFVLAAAIAALTFACGDDSDSGASAGSASSAATGPGGGGGGGGGVGSAGEGAGFLPLYCADACTKVAQCRADQFNADYGSLPECISACETENASLADESLQCQSAITAQAGCYNALSCDAFNAVGEDGAETCADVDAAVEALCADLLGSGLPGMSGSGIPGFSGSGLPGMSGSGLPGMSGSGLPGMSGSGLPGGSESTSEPLSSASLYDAALTAYCTQWCGTQVSCDNLDVSDTDACLADCREFTVPRDVVADGDATICAVHLASLATCEQTIDCAEFLEIYSSASAPDPDFLPTCVDELIDLTEDCG